jgi:hypothetical protein
LRSPDSTVSTGKHDSYNADASAIPRTVTGQHAEDMTFDLHVANAATEARGFAGQQRRQLTGTKATVSREQRIHDAEAQNLQRSRWLGAFTEPLFHTCPLVARKISSEAVSEFAALAWRCDGLGFAWECLERAQKRTDEMQ